MKCNEAELELLVPEVAENKHSILGILENVRR